MNLTRHRGSRQAYPPGFKSNRRSGFENDVLPEVRQAMMLKNAVRPTECCKSLELPRFVNWRCVSGQSHQGRGRAENSTTPAPQQYPGARRARYVTACALHPVSQHLGCELTWDSNGRPRAAGTREKRGSLVRIQGFAGAPRTNMPPSHPNAPLAP
jgi:hypothetical protein